MSVTTYPASDAVRVLVVEDSEVDARVLETVLQRSGFTAHRATSLRGAVTALRSGDFDVILSDLGLPDSDGLDTVDALLRHAVSLPIVVMTGRDDEETALRAVAAGAQDYLVKGSTNARDLARSIRYAVERGRTMREISSSEARLRTILDAALDAVVSMNHDGLIVLWNRSAEELFGWRRSEVLGRPLAEVIVPLRFRHAHERGRCAFLDSGDSSFVGKRVEWVALRRDGSEFPVEVRITADADRVGMTFTAFISDITARRRAEEERATSEMRFRTLEHQLEQGARVASLGRVSASVAHEFNNLLMSVSPFAELLWKRGQEDPALEKPANHVLNAVRRGQRLTDELLRFTHPPEPRIVTLDLAAAIADLADEARGLLAERRLEVELPTALTARVDPDQLVQVLLNLVTNARDATETGGTVTIGAAPAAELPFLLQTFPAPGDFAAIYVRDDGCGISAEAKQRIFEPFFTASRKRRGTGLGLAVAYRIVDQHGGHILLESEPGEGSTFYVMVPISPEQRP
ncbi:MAG TPA: ATP-binding protein [Thermoanaerobaculia bacterium]|jgi:hypothetical protein